MSGNKGATWQRAVERNKARKWPSHFRGLPSAPSSGDYGVIRGDKINRLKRVWERPFRGVETGGLEGDINGHGPGESPECGRRR